MTASFLPPAPTLTSRIVNGLLSIKPLANFAKRQARTMMIKRAATLGVYWHQEAQALGARGSDQDFAAAWYQDLEQLTNPHLQYPDYYLTSFHAYEEGNLGWDPALEVEPAAKTVHAKIWPEQGANGDAHLRHSYHQVLQQQLPTAPQAILDLGCSTGLSTFSLHQIYPQAQITGLDLSPYYLAVAQYRALQQELPIDWVHGAAEATGLPDQSFDLVSICLVAHELPRTATRQIFQEVRRLLRSGAISP